MKVVPHPAVDLSSVPAALRRLAENIERGDYGSVECCAVSIQTQEGRCEVFSSGSRSGIAEASFTLSLGLDRLYEFWRTQGGR